MLTRKEYKEIQQLAAKMIVESGVVVGPEELENIAVADFGLRDMKNEGGQILTLFATDPDQCKIITLIPIQTLPKLWHPPVGNDPEKEEIVRAISGEVRVYILGDDDLNEGVYFIKLKSSGFGK